MKTVKILLALLLTLALLPVSAVGDEGDLTGRWTATIDGDVFTLFLGTDNAFIVLYDENGTVSRDTGSWALVSEKISLTLMDGSVTRLDYNLTGSTLTAKEENTDNWASFYRQPWVAPAGVSGEWVGNDKNGDFLLVLLPDNHFSLNYVSGEAIGSGIFADYSGTLYLSMPDNNWLIFTYSLSGGGMTITDKNTGDSYPLISRAASVTAIPDSIAPPVSTPQPSEPGPDWLTEETPVPAPETTEAQPEWLTEETPVPAPETTEIQPDWLTEATPAPAPETTADMTSITSETPLVTPGLVGAWHGKDAAGVRTLIFTEDGNVSISYEDMSNAALAKSGTYTSGADVIMAAYADGSAETFRYMLIGDTLLLSDGNLQNPITYARSTEPAAVPDPALVGTWGGGEKENYAEYNFGGDSQWSLMYPADESRNETGSWTAAGGNLSLLEDEQSVGFAYTIEGDLLRLASVGREENDMLRKTGLLTRGTQETGVVLSSAADPALVGTWGGVSGEMYIEWTFKGDGSYVSFVPQDEVLGIRGTWMASSDLLVTLAPEGSTQYTYQIDGETLGLAGPATVTLTRKIGPLMRLPGSGE